MAGPCARSSSLEPEFSAFRREFALSIDAFVVHMSGRLVLIETGRKVFQNAELVVHENEPKHWFDDAAISRARVPGNRAAAIRSCRRLGGRRFNARIENDNEKRRPTRSPAAFF